MRTNSFYTRFCLMMIQSAILAGCTGGHKAKNSTAALRAKNAAAKSAANQNAGTPVVVEKGSNLALDIKMGDFEQYQPIKKNDLDNHFVKLEKIKEPIAFDYFTNKPVSIVMVMMASFDNKEKQEAGVAISRSYFVFNGDKIKTKDEAEKAMEPTAEKIINEKDYKEADYVQDIYAFLVKDNKIAAVKYQNRRAISGTAAKSSAKNLSGSEFKNEAKMICVFTD